MIRGEPDAVVRFSIPSLVAEPANVSIVLEIEILVNRTVTVVVKLVPDVRHGAYLTLLLGHWGLCS